MSLGDQLHIGSSVVLTDRVAPVANRKWMKPNGGFWTSSYVNGASEWVKWCESDGFMDPSELCWHVLTPDPTARVFHVDAVEDLKLLLQIGTGHFDHGMSRPDFEAISMDFDAINLTSAGQWRTRHSEPSLYGWDCESTLWFRWKFSDVRRVAARFRTPVAEEGQGEEAGA